MADIQLRFQKDVLVLTPPTTAELARLGIDTEKDVELTMLIEPEVFDDIYELDKISGAQIYVANTASLTPARLSHIGMEDRGKVLAKAAVSMIQPRRPQHILAELAPCGLPLDASSKASLVENRDQYSRAAAFFDDIEFDAFFLNGFMNCTSLKCALMGLRKVSDKPIFASVDIDEGGILIGSAERRESLGVHESAGGWSSDLESIEDAAAVMAEYGANVAGFNIAADQTIASAMVERMKSVTYLPILVQLEVGKRDPEQASPTEANPYFEPDTMVDAADILVEAGVQFLRATGDATPAYAGALVAATAGRDVVASEAHDDASADTVDEDPAALAERLRAKVADQLKKQNNG